jgi:hypothetical protein
LGDIAEVETIARSKRPFVPRHVDRIPGKRYVTICVPADIHYNFVVNAAKRNVPVGNLWRAFVERYAADVDLDTLNVPPKFRKTQAS